MQDTESTPPELKQVGRSGQISLGKRYAGKTLQLEYRDDGTIVLTPVVPVPETQLWTLEARHRQRIERALEWAATHSPSASDLDETIGRARHGRKAREG